ncbi:MAG: tetratricopeptide repeat protein [Alphaproteobacteria bacterium]
MVLALGVFAFALLLRIIFAVQWQHMPYGIDPLLDARAYDDWALSIIDGQASNDHAFYQSPVYPYLLAILYSVTGHSIFAASLLNAVLDSATASLLALIGFTLFGRLAGVITGLLAAAYAPMIFYTAPLMKESLTLFLLTLFLALALRILQQNRLRDYGVCGLVLGLAVLARGNALFLMPVVPLLAWLRYRRAALRGAGLFVLACLVAVLPATWHNYVVAHDFVPITYADGFNLYVGHSPYANGVNAYPPGISTDPEHERAETSWIAEHETGRQLKPSEISSFWRMKAIDFARANPQREAELLGLKFLAFWNDAERADNYDAGFIKQNFSSLLNMPLTSFGLIAALAVFAAFGTRGFVRREDKQLYALLPACVFLYMASVLIFYVTDRYRLPAVVFLMPLAGAAVPCAMQLWEQRRKRQLLVAACAGFFFLALALYPMGGAADLSAQNWGTLTAMYADAGQPEPALDAFQKGLAISPQGIGAQAYIRAAEMHEKSGNPDEAAKLVQRAAELYPTDGVTLYNLGRLQAMQGHLDTALATLHRAIELAPTYGLSYYALAMIYEKQGDTARAHEALQQGLAANPGDPQFKALMEKGRLR